MPRVCTWPLRAGRRGGPAMGLNCAALTGLVWCGVNRYPGRHRKLLTAASGFALGCNLLALSGLQREGRSRARPPGRRATCARALPVTAYVGATRESPHVARQGPRCVDRRKRRRAARKPPLHRPSPLTQWHWFLALTGRYSIAQGKAGA